MKTRYLKNTVIAAAVVVICAAGTMSVHAESINSDMVSAGVSAAVSTILTNSSDAQVSENETTTSQEATTYYGYTNLGIANVDNYLNIRESASEDAELVGKLPVNAGCEILSEENGWYQILSGEVTGYVKADYLLTGNDAIVKADEVAQTVAIVQTTTLNVRKEPSTDCSILAQVGDSEALPVLEQDGDWIKVSVDNEEGYVSAEFVEVSIQLEDALTMTEVRYGEGVSDVRADVVSYALQFVGNRYVWGGTSLTNGVDCSGFTMQILAKYGISLPHSSAAQPAYGTKISASAAQPGDLFFYGSGSQINHVGMYIGGGQIVHASGEKTGIKISNAFYRTPICVVSYLN